MNASAHENHFPSDGHNVWREHGCQRQIRHWPTAIHSHFVRAGANRADYGVGGGLGLSLDLSKPGVRWRQRLYFVTASAVFVEAAQKSFVSKRPRAKHLISHLGFSLGVDQRFLGAHVYRYFRTT